MKKELKEWIAKATLLNIINDFDICEGDIEGIKGYKLEYYNGNEKRLIVPPVDSLCNRAFYKCYNIEYIEIPESIIEIPSNIFNGLHKLREVKIKSNTKWLPIGTFENCINLDKVDLLGNIERIGGYCFIRCEKLEQIKLPNTVEYIGKAAFSSCGLKTFTIPESVTDIEIPIVHDCSNLEELIILSKNLEIVNHIQRKSLDNKYIIKLYDKCNIKKIRIHKEILNDIIDYIPVEDEKYIEFID